MYRIIYWLIIFFEIIEYIIIVDVILSWLLLFWIRFRPKILADLIDPFYNFIRKNLPSSFWPFDFTPIILILVLTFIRGLIITFFLK
jgi:uncharacterized protein YggT (Ycf19 family)